MQGLIGMKEVVIGSAEHEGREAGESLMREIPADNKNWNKYQPLKMRGNDYKYLLFYVYLSYHGEKTIRLGCNESNRKKIN
jgi:hypothetical protein